jgi:cyclopropane-fatty-acyl-phospholipid synthase
LGRVRDKPVGPPGTQEFVRAGNLTITTARGTSYSLIDGTGEPVAPRFTTLAAERGVVLDPELELGESFMDGTLIVEQGSIADQSLAGE